MCRDKTPERSKKFSKQGKTRAEFHEMRRQWAVEVAAEVSGNYKAASRTKTSGNYKAEVSGNY